MTAPRLIETALPDYVGFTVEGSIASLIWSRLGHTWKFDFGDQLPSYAADLPAAPDLASARKVAQDFFKVAPGGA